MLESRIKWNAQNRYILIEKDAYFSFHKANCEIALPSFSVKQFFITLLLWKVLWSFWFSQLTFKARQVLLHVEKKRKVDWKCNSAIKTINRVLSVIDPEKKLENLLDFVLIKEKMFKLCWKEVLTRNHQVLLYEPGAFLQLPFVWEARRNSSQ